MNSLNKEQYEALLSRLVWEKDRDIIKLSSPDIPLKIECGLFSERRNREVCFFAFDRIVYVELGTGFDRDSKVTG